MKLLCDVLAEGAVICPLTETDKWKAIEECVMALPQVKSGELTPEDAILSIKEREAQEQSTMLENGVSIPHGILPDPAPLMCALGVSREGVLYNEKGEKSQIMFILLGSVSARRDYLACLAQIARRFRGPDLKEKLLEANSTDEALKFISAAEGK